MGITRCLRGHHIILQPVSPAFGVAIYSRSAIGLGSQHSDRLAVMLLKEHVQGGLQTCSPSFSSQLSSSSSRDQNITPGQSLFSRLMWPGVGVKEACKNEGPGYQLELSREWAFFPLPQQMPSSPFRAGIYASSHGRTASTCSHVNDKATEP